MFKDFNEVKENDDNYYIHIDDYVKAIQYSKQFQSKINNYPNCLKNNQVHYTENIPPKSKGKNQHFLNYLESDYCLNLRINIGLLFKDVKVKPFYYFICKIII